MLIDRTPQRYFCNVREIELRGKRDEREPTLRDSAVTVRYLSASIERALDGLLSAHILAVDALGIGTGVSLATNDSGLLPGATSITLAMAALGHRWRRRLGNRPVRI